MRTIVLGFVLALCSLAVHAQVGTWRAYMSYYEPQQIVKVNHSLFVRASHSLYSYNLNDQSITTYDKVKQLNDTRVNFISWNKQAHRLLIVYDNCNMDLMTEDGNVTNLSAFYNKAMTVDKTVNNVGCFEQYAYLSTAFGVVKVNMERAEVAESYVLNHNVLATVVQGGKILIRTKDEFTVPYSTPNAEVAPGNVVSEQVLTYDRNHNPLTKKVVIEAVYEAPLTANLIDPHSWTFTNQVSMNVFNEDLSDWNEYAETVKALAPGGPKHNYFAFMRFINGTLYTCGGGYTAYKEEERPATVQLCKNGEWTLLQDDVKGNFDGTTGSWQFIDMHAVDVDPLDEKHIFAGGRTGLYEYYDGKLLHYYNKDNSPLEPATTSNRYVLVEGLKFDDQGNLFLVQSNVPTNTIIEITKDGKWVKHPQSLLTAPEDGKQKALCALTGMIKDSRGLMWMVNDHYRNPGVFAYDPWQDGIAFYMKTLINQDGKTYDHLWGPHCLLEDLNGDIWIGCIYGLYQIEMSGLQGGNIDHVTQVKVPRNDGTNYADYLLTDVNISCMALDGAGRKWIGTNGAGVYLISADNMEQVNYFTSSNSPLLSNNVESIAINNETGEVFFGTDQGLCSYQSDATAASIDMTKDNVYAYPNPVVSDYNGLITIVGLSLDADVKILSSDGRLVAQGRSNGGTFTWNGCDRNGKRVASGVYMVATAKSDGSKGTVCKIAMIK